MTATITPIAAHEAIAKAAATPNTAVRHVKAIAIGEHCRQGDIYVERIKAATKGWKPSKNRQLAPGTSQGSRHVVAGDVALTVSGEARPVARAGNVARLLGPQIVAKGRFKVEHPEHAHLSLPAGTYQVSYQMDWSSQRAVRD